MNDIIKNGLGPGIIVYSEAAISQMPDEIEDIENGSIADEPVDYEGYIKDAAFVGEYPFAVIIEGIRNQFANYIATEDRTDYVDIFYNQYHNSYEVAEEQDFPADCREALETYLDQFLAVMQELFSGKLTITLLDLDGETEDKDSVEDAIRKLYEFFILNARQNFKIAITRHCYKQIDPNLEDRLFYSRIREVLYNYSPIITVMGPQEFLRYCNNSEPIIEMSESGRINGNFLRKYSPRLYQNEGYECEIIAYITSVIELYKETKDITKAMVRKEEEDNAAE